MKHLQLVRDPAKTLPTIPDPQSWTSARIWFCKYKTMTPLAELVNLEQLEVAGFPDATLDDLAGLTHLRVLRLQNFPKVVDLAPLAQLKKLETLALATPPSWDASRKKHIVASLEPLTKLPALRHIELFRVAPKSERPDELSKCKALRSARLTGYAAKDLEAFHKATGLSDDFAPELDAPKDLPPTQL